MSGENNTGAERLTTFYVLGERIRPVTYSVVDGLAVAEGCIILGTAEEAAAARARAIAEPGLVRHSVEALGSGIIGGQYRWPNKLVPFVIDPALPQPERVTEAIAHWHQATQIRFVPRAPTQLNYIAFVPGSGCMSPVGMRGGRQLITLGTDCTRGNCIHEIGHAMGLWHEQSRIDRDAHVEILWENIEAGAEPNFYQQLYDGQDIGAYDYASVMHYGLDAFTANGQPTIRVVGDARGAHIGQRDGLSAGDRETIAKLYP